MDLHSLIVHFPITLLIVGAGFDAVGVIRKVEMAARTGYILLALGALGGIAAAFTGETAAEMTSRVPGITQDLGEHEDFGTATVWIAVLLLLLRTRVMLRKRFVGATRGVYLLVAISLAALVAFTGYTGGRLVHLYGAGTASVNDRIQTEEPTIQRGTP